MTSSAAVLSKVGNRVGSVVASVAVAIHDNNPCDPTSARHPLLASKAAASEAALADVEEASEAASVVTGEVVLAIEAASAEEEVLDTKVVEDLEDEVGMLMVLLHPTHQAVQVADAVDLPAKPMALLHPNTVTAVVMVIVIGMAIGAVAPPEAQGMTTEIREAESVAVTENPLPLETEDTVEIETETEKGIEIVRGMAAAMAVAVAVAAAADETMTTAREKDTTKVMGTMTHEAKEDTESPSLSRQIFFPSLDQKNSTVCLVGIYVFRFLRLLLLLLLA